MTSQIETATLVWFVGTWLLALSFWCGRQTGRIDKLADQANENREDHNRLFTKLDDLAKQAERIAALEAEHTHKNPNP